MNREPSAVPVLGDLLEKPGCIGPADVRHMRGEVFRDGVVSFAEADAIFALDMATSEKCAEWTEFFVEALTDFTVNQAEPRGCVSLANAQWLIDRVSHDGHLDTVTELELLVKVLDRSQSSPELLVRYVMSEIGRAVLEGEGPLACGRTLEKGAIGEAEVELIRRVMYAFGGEAGISISRTEAETLFDLNDRSVQSKNHPAWNDLFVRAVANYLMAASSYKAPSRAVALVREEWLEDDSTDVRGTIVGAFAGLGQMLTKGFFDDIVDAHEQMERAWADRNHRVEQAESAAAVVDSEEVTWLIDRLDSDGMLRDNEKALLRFIRAESPDIHPKLKPWLEKSA
jgi:hypothetical protein